MSLIDEVIENFEEYIYSCFEPKLELTVSEWADRYYYLPDSASESGKYYIEKTPYLKEPLDCVNNPRVWKIPLMFSTQTGKSEAVNIIIGYHIHQRPRSIIMVQPDEQVAKEYMEERIEGAINATPVLKEVVVEKLESSKKREKTLTKPFKGGILNIVWATSPSKLASKPRGIIIFDETDRYEPTKEGDPIKIGEKRAITFLDRLIVPVSTPSTKNGKSRIKNEYDSGDKRKYNLPCPFCCFKDIVLELERFKWEKDRPETVQLICPHCGSYIDEKYKFNMLRDGEWIAEREFNGIASFWLNEFYSPWKSWREVIRDFLDARNDPEKLKVFVETSLCEPWKDNYMSNKGLLQKLLERREEYSAEVPAKVIFLTAGVDVQADRLECEVIGWGVKKENWSIDYKIFYGSPLKSEVWGELEIYLNSTFLHELGFQIPIWGCGIDTGGVSEKESFADRVYKFVQDKFYKNILAFKGSSVKHKPIISLGSKVGVNRDVQLFLIGTDTAKSSIFSYLTSSEEQEGYSHFRIDYKEEYFKQLLSEAKNESGDWVKFRNRNEVLDVRVYNFAMYEYFISQNGEDLESLQKDLINLYSGVDLRGESDGSEEVEDNNDYMREF